MRILAIGDPQRAEIKSLIARAQAKPFDAATLKHAMEVSGDALLVWKHRLDEFTLELPIGFLVTYTVEEQPPGLCHHISISVDALGWLPPPDAVKMICIEFGILGEDAEVEKLTIVGTWVEEYDAGRKAINILTLGRELSLARLN